MARPIKNGLDYFPIWNYQDHTFRKYEYKSLYKSLRNSSSNFVNKSIVKDRIFKRDDYKCIICNSTKDLTIDHRITVWQVARNLFPIDILNSYNNLRTLCKSCNSKT